MRRRDPHTKDLFAWEPEPVAVAYGDEVAGRGDLESQISHVVARALRDAKDAGVARPDVAGRMAQYLGRTLTKGDLDKWASEANDDRRIPLDAFIALAKVTETPEMIGFVASFFDMAVVSSRFVDLIELHQLQEHQAQVDARVAALKAKTRGAR